MANWVAKPTLQAFVFIFDFKSNSSCREIFYKSLKIKTFNEVNFFYWSQNCVRILLNIFHENVRQKNYNFWRKFDNFSNMRVKISSIQSVLLSARDLGVGKSYPFASRVGDSIPTYIRYKFRKKKIFSTKVRIFSNFIEHFSKIFAKMIETFVFEPHFRMAYQNFELEIERKCGNLNSVSVLAHSKVLN